MFSERGIFKRELFSFSIIITYIKKNKLVLYMRHPGLRSTMMVRFSLSPSPDILHSSLLFLWLGGQGLMDCFPWAPLPFGFLFVGPMGGISRKSESQVREAIMSSRYCPRVFGGCISGRSCASHSFRILFSSLTAPPLCLLPSHWVLVLLSPALILSYLGVVMAPCCC